MLLVGGEVQQWAAALGLRKCTLMAPETSLFSTYPVKSNERQAHGNEYETQCRETRSLNLWSGVHGLLVVRDDANVKQPRKDEYQSGSSGCTSNSKNVSNVGNEDDQAVDRKQQTHCDGDVTHPAEGFAWKQELQEGTTDRKQDHRNSQSNGHEDSEPNTEDQNV